MDNNNRSSYRLLLIPWFYTFHLTGRSRAIPTPPTGVTFGGMLIGDLAERSGVPARTIRFYEQSRVLTAPARSAGGYRLYSDRALAELTFVKRAQRLGFSLENIREILGLGRSGRMPCDRVTALCDAHLSEIDRQLAELQLFRKLLKRVRRKAKAGCGFTADGFCKAIMGL